jgi:hypothetical protein
VSDVTGPPSSSTSAPPPGAIGTTVAGRYRVERELARGGMGAVYVAWDEKFSQRVALKLSEGGGAQYAAFKARFRREAEIGNRLGRVEGFVRALDWGAIEGTSYLYLTMDLIEGARPLDLASGTVHDRLRRLRRAVRIVAAAHKQHVIHRDLKPANFLQAADGTMHLTDFGLAKVHGEDSRAEEVTLAGEELTQTGTGMGTPLYMPPEQFEDAASVDERADVYALGVMLFFALTGRHPFPGGSFQTLWIAQQKVLEGKTPAPSAARVDPTVAAELDALCARAIALVLGQRLGTAEELLRGLDAALGATERMDPTVLEKSGFSLAGQAPTGVEPTPRLPSTAGDGGQRTTRGLAPTVTPQASGRVATATAVSPGERRRGPGLLLAAALVATGFAAWVVSSRLRPKDRPVATATERTTTTTITTEPATTATEPVATTATEPVATTVTEPVATTVTEPVATTVTESPVATTTEPVATTTTEPEVPPPPLALILTSPAEAELVTSSARIELRGKIEHWATARVRPALLLDGVPVDVAEDGSFVAARELLRDGQHTVELALEDQVERRTITLDRAPPALLLEPVAPRSMAAKVALRGAAPGAVEVTIAGKPVALAADGAFSVTLPLTPGQNRFDVVALDSVANRATTRVDVVRAPWARVGLLAALPGQPATDLLHLASGARVPRGTRVKVGVQLSAGAAVWVVESRDGAQKVLRAPRRPGRPDPADTDLIVPNRRSEWLVLTTPGEVELVVTLTTSRSPTWTPELAPAAREATAATLPDDATDFLLVTQDGAATHHLTPLWVEDGADGLTWRVRLTVE